MKISKRQWDDYILTLRKCSDTAAAMMQAYWESHTVVSLHDWNLLIEYAFGLSTKYGTAAAAAACELYDAIALASGAKVGAAIPALPAEYSDVAAAIREAAKSNNGVLVGAVLDRLVKQPSLDTMAFNAVRDGAEWAWIPSGTTCAFCISLASRGWQKASKKALRGGHAQHIHPNCNCSYSIRFDGETQVEGYDPADYLDLYQSAAGRNAKSKLNAIRREFYAEDREEINRRKREAYRLRKERQES